MTAKEIKRMNKEIARLRSKIIRLKNEAAGTTPNLSDMPHVSGISDKIGTAVTQIVDIQREIQNLETLRNSEINRLSRDVLEENCLFMRLHLNYSWTKIAIECGGGNTKDSVRMMCERYEW